MSAQPPNSGCINWFTKIFVILMCLGLGWAGVAAVQTGWREWQNNQESGTWPEATGTVRRSFVDHVIVKTLRGRISFPAGINFPKTGQAGACPVFLAFSSGQKLRSISLYPALPSSL